MSDLISLYPSISSEAKLQRLVEDAVGRFDDGECFLEMKATQFLSCQNGQILRSDSSLAQGYGLRAVSDEATLYVHSNDISLASIEGACRDISSNHVIGNAQCRYSNLCLPTASAGLAMYSNHDPMIECSIAERVLLTQRVEEYIRQLDPRVINVVTNIGCSLQTVHIIQPSKEIVHDTRPLVNISIQVTLKSGERCESGYSAFGGRDHVKVYIIWNRLEACADEALRIAKVNMESVPTSAGEKVVVLGKGWPGVLIHEAVGHGLEADFNRKGVSMFSNLLGKKVAADCVSVTDHGALAKRRGSLLVDDEGTPTQENVLIKDGVLLGYMQDKVSARKMGVPLTGNGRRESFQHPPMPRMTNTYMLAGDSTPQEIISSVEDGVYAVNFGGGQVDITSGRFVFFCTEAYMIKQGKIQYPIKGATLIGQGIDVLSKIVAVGNDLALDDGSGTCVKDGQCVPVGVGMPTVRIDGITVGGSLA